MNNVTELLNADWIWLGTEAVPPHQYVCFRKTIKLETIPDTAIFDISVDSDFILTINEVEIGRGQFSDYPQEKTFSRFDVISHLREGENFIAILAYYRGEDFSDHRAGEAGLIASLRLDDLVVSSNNIWKCAPHPGFASGPMPKVTGQQGFTTKFDARNDIDWASEKLNDNDWLFAETKASGTKGFWKKITPRPVPVLDFHPAIDAEIVTQGVFIRKTPDAESTAEIMQNDALITKGAFAPFLKEAFASFTKEGASASLQQTPLFSHHADGAPIVATLKPINEYDGAYFIVDLGREEVGLISFTLDAPAGTLIEFGHGEHLVDGRVRIHLGGRNFADSYICRDGENSYTLPFRRIGGRYIEVHVSNFTTPVAIKYFGLRPLTLPNLTTCEFSASDTMLNEIHKMSIHTLKCCMHEHYEDTPWREQSLYAFDSRNQALYGYYAFGNYDFAAASFDLLGRGIRDDGLLELCAPAKVSVTIPIFSLVWITELAEHWMHSGESTLFNKFKNQIQTMFDIIFARFDSGSQLYLGPLKNAVNWHFYEWVPGLDGYDPDTPEGRLDAPYNLFLHEAIASYAQMLVWSGNESEAESLTMRNRELGENIDKCFWNDDEQCLNTFLSEDKKYGTHQLTQALALSEGVLSAEHEKTLISGLNDPKLVKMTLSSMLYLQKALSGKNDAELFEIIHDNWSLMVKAGATTCWETIDGDAAFDTAGSLCHAWSALPVYYHHSTILGIKPLSPGFKTFEVKPYVGPLTHAKGEVMTPYGKISVEWTKTENGIDLSVDAPNECARRTS